MTDRRLTPLTRPLCAVAAGALLLLAGCASFPSPGPDTDSLFILYAENPAPRIGPERGPNLLRFEGPSRFQIGIGDEERKGYYVRVKPGRYTLTGEVPAGQEASSIDVPAGAIVLFPMKFTRVREGLARIRRFVPVAPEDQKNASALLTDYLDFEKWFGRAVVGFGPFPPRLSSEEGNVEFEISSTPPGAQVIIDDVSWGTTPVTTTLSAGKHHLQLEIPGVALANSFIDVQGKGEINVTLPLLAEQEVKAEKEKSQKIKLLLTGFQNMGSQEFDNLQSVFPQVIGSDLRDDERIVLVDAGELVARGAGIPGKPDFALANQKGINLIVSGYYTARPDGLLVYAALYDVEGEIARTSIMYTGKTGLAMFDSIDGMAAQFIKGIDKVIPDVRRSTVQAGAAAETKVVTYERKRSQTAMIEKRQEMKSSLSFIIGPSITGIGNIYQPAFPNALLALVPLGIMYDRSDGGPVSLLAILQPAVAFGPAAQPGADYTTYPYLDIPLRVGPEYTIFGSSVDLSFALLAEARYTQAWFDSGTGSTVYRGIMSGALVAETTARLYLQTRVSEKPSFFLIGFVWFLVGGQVNTDFSSPQLTPMELAVSIGYGFRL